MLNNLLKGFSKRSLDKEYAIYEHDLGIVYGYVKTLVDDYNSYDLYMLHESPVDTLKRMLHYLEDELTQSQKGISDKWIFDEETMTIIFNGKYFHQTFMKVELNH